MLNDAATEKPILLIDVMETLVNEPMRRAIPEFFQMPTQELFDAKSYEAFLAIERGHIDEEEYGRRFFKDGRGIDIAALKQVIYEHMDWLEGSETLLRALGEAGYQMHTLSNYSAWYQIIEDKLTLSQYLPWTFVSCKTGLRKPEPETYLEAARTLQVDPSACLFIDDREKNVAGAHAVGMSAFVRDPDFARFTQQLREAGIDVL